jgi:hypothetical protein
MDMNEKLTKNLNSWREALNAIPAVEKVLKAFDGKVFNVRLKNALNDAVPNLYLAVRNDENAFSIDIDPYRDYINICRIMRRGKTHRIDAAPLIASLKEREKVIEETIRETEAAFPRLDEIKAERERILSEIEKFNKIPWMLNAAYSLRIELRSNW